MWFPTLERCTQSGTLRTHRFWSRRRGSCELLHSHTPPVKDGNKNASRVTTVGLRSSDGGIGRESGVREGRRGQWLGRFRGGWKMPNSRRSTSQQAHANFGTHYHQWECSHRLQARSKGLCVCTQICMQICLRVLCEWRLGLKKPQFHQNNFGKYPTTEVIENMARTAQCSNMPCG